MGNTNNGYTSTVSGDVVALKPITEINGSEVESARVANAFVAKLCDPSTGETKRILPDKLSENTLKEIHEKYLKLQNAICKGVGEKVGDVEQLIRGTINLTPQAMAEIQTLLIGLRKPKTINSSSNQDVQIPNLAEPTVSYDIGVASGQSIKALFQVSYIDPMNKSLIGIGVSEKSMSLNIGMKVGDERSVFANVKFDNLWD